MYPGIRLTTEEKARKNLSVSVEETVLPETGFEV
jgi:hypothetical protein